MKSLVQNIFYGLSLRQVIRTLFLILMLGLLASCSTDTLVPEAQDTDNTRNRTVTGEEMVTLYKSQFPEATDLEVQEFEQAIEYVKAASNGDNASGLSTQAWSETKKLVHGIGTGKWSNYNYHRGRSLWYLGQNINWTKDGCSTEQLNVELDPTTGQKFKNLFADDCNQHDFAYTNFKNHGLRTYWRRHQADAAFYWNMIDTCNWYWNWGSAKHTACVGGASAFYTAVRYGGWVWFY